MAMLLLFLLLAYEVRIEAYARIIHEHTAIYFTDVHIRDLAGENVADSGFEMPRNANILSEMVQRTHWKDTNGGIGTCQDAGHGADGAVASARHHQMTVPLKARAAREEISSPLRVTTTFARTPSSPEIRAI